MSRLRKHAPLAQKFALASVTLTLLVALVIGGVALGFIRAHLYNDIQEDLQRQAGLQAQKLELHLGSSLHSMELLSQNPLTMNALVDSVGREVYLRPFLNAFKVSPALNADIGLFDFQGHLIAASDEAVEPDISKEAVFERAMMGKGASDYHQHDDTGYIALALPVVHIATDQPEGVLLARIDVTPIFISGSTAQQPELMMHLTTAAGIMVAESAWSTDEATLSFSQPLSLPQPLDQEAFILTVGVEKAYAMAPIDRFMVITLLSAFGVVLLALPISIWLGYRLSRPLVDLTHAADNIANKGDFRQPLPLDGPTEVGQLAQSFRKMLDRLNDSYQTLEDRVNERTAELRQTQLHLQDSARRLETILDNIVDGIFTIDQSGWIESTNTAAQKLFAHPAAQFSDKNISTIIPGIKWQHFERDPTAFQNVGFETSVTRADGKSLFVAVVFGMEFEVGGKKLFPIIVRDISPRKQVEKAKDEFISAVSHELRTPLTSIRGAMSLLNSGRKEPLPARAKQLIDIAYKNCERLETLVDDILDVEKLESGTLEIDRIETDIVAVVTQSLESTAPYISSHFKNARLWNMLESALVLGDADRLVQVMNNLLSNAAKYSSDVSTIDIFISVYDGQIRVTVANRGPGIGMEFRKKIFQRFGQENSEETRNVGGTGLGLAISKAIIEQHGGTLEYCTRIKEGAVFYFDLPLLSTPTYEPKPEDETSRRVAVGPDNHPDFIKTLQIVDEQGLAPAPLRTATEAVFYGRSKAFTREIFTTSPDAADIRTALQKALQHHRFAIIWLSPDTGKGTET